MLSLPSLFLVVFRHKTRVTPSQNQLYWATRPDNAGHALQGIILEIKSSSFPNITSGSEREKAALEVRKASRPNLAVSASGFCGGGSVWVSGFMVLGSRASGAPSREGQDEGCSAGAQ